MKCDLKQIKKLKFTEMIFFGFIATKPLYIWGSGSLQISELIMLLLFFLLFGKSHVISWRTESEKKWLACFFGLVAYQIVINMVWTFILNNQGYSGNLFKASLYYLFNFMVALLILKIRTLYGFDRLKSLYLSGTLASCILCCIGIILNFKTNTSRQTGFFNNPNQLGYFSIITMTVALLFRKDYSKWSYRFIVVASLVMNILSLSKASLISAAALLILNSFLVDGNRDIKKLAKKVGSLLAVGILIYVVMFSNFPILTQNRTITILRYKIINMSNESDSDMGEGRGYDRISEIGINAVWGVGEGINERFTVKTDKEVHSMYASLIVCYGLIGFAGYMYLMAKPFYRFHDWKIILLSSGLVLYCFTHNGIRNTMLWGLLSVLLVSPLLSKERKTEV